MTAGHAGRSVTGRVPARRAQAARSSATGRAPARRAKPAKKAGASGAAPRPARPAERVTARRAPARPAQQATGETPARPARQAARQTPAKPARQATGKTPAKPAPKTPARPAQRAVVTAIEKQSGRVVLPYGIGQVRVPSADRLAFYGGIATLALLGIVEWPVALVIGVGHLLADDRHHKLLADFGEALGEA
jgi:hypothetical protein